MVQAGGASRIVEENRKAAGESPCEADNPSDMFTRMGNYMGSWLGLGTVPEHEGAGDWIRPLPSYMWWCQARPWHLVPPLLAQQVGRAKSYCCQSVKKL